MISLLHLQIRQKISGGLFKMRNYHPYDEGRGAYGAAAEEHTLDLLRKIGVNAVLTKDYFYEEWTPRLDAEVGDIQVLSKDDSEIVASIDVKRAGPNTPDIFVGTISYTDASDKFRNNPDAWYLLFNKNMEKFIWLKASSIKDNPPKNGKFWTTAEIAEYARD